MTYKNRTLILQCLFCLIWINISFFHGNSHRWGWRTLCLPHWCLMHTHSQSARIVFTWCQPFNVKMPTTLSPSFCCCLHLSWSLFKQLHCRIIPWVYTCVSTVHMQVNYYIYFYSVCAAWRSVQTLISLHNWIHYLYLSVWSTKSNVLNLNIIC